MDILSAEEAAKLLHLNVKRVQGLARSGRLPASRLGRKWLFHRRDLDRLLGRTAAASVHASLEISARNRLRGEVVAMRVDGLMAEVVLAIGEQQLVSIITASSAERLGLRVGVSAFAVVKSTEVMIGRGEMGE